MTKQEANSVQPTSAKKKKFKVTFVGVKPDGSLNGFFSTWREAVNALNDGSISNVSIWMGKTKISA
jgi:hypothetical protein